MKSATGASEENSPSRNSVTANNSQSVQVGGREQQDKATASVPAESAQTANIVADSTTSLERPKDRRGKPVTGHVRVEVVIDEEGKVISARAIDGNKELREAAVAASMKARFTPTTSGGQLVKVKGVLTYNFVMDKREGGNK